MCAVAEPLDQGCAGWHAQLTLGFECRQGRTVLAHKRQHGPLTVQRPFYPEGEACHLYLLHPPGGVVGGDRLEIRAEVGEGAHALLTTPGAAKLYRSGGPCASQHQRLRVSSGAMLEWLPQENILFPGARLRMRTEVELSGSGRFIGWEIHSLGRPALTESFAPGDADLGLAVYRNGKPLLLERLRLGAREDLAGPSGLRGFPLCATLIATGVRAEDLDAARAAVPIGEGAPLGLTLVEDVLIARGLGHAVEPLRRLLVAVWGILRSRLLGRTACPPRIWAT
jgi:urease accessory protein